MITDTDAEQWAFNAFANAHPYECFLEYPDRFWEYFRSLYPSIDRPVMERLLMATAAEFGEA